MSEKKAYFTILEKDEPVFWYGHIDGNEIVSDILSMLNKRSVNRVIIEEDDIATIGFKDSDNKKLILVAKKDGIFLLFQLLKKTIENSHH